MKSKALQIHSQRSVTWCFFVSQFSSRYNIPCILTYCFTFDFYWWINQLRKKMNTYECTIISTCHKYVTERALYWHYIGKIFGKHSENICNLFGKYLPSSINQRPVIVNINRPSKHILRMDQQATKYQAICRIKGWLKLQGTCHWCWHHDFNKQCRHDINKRCWKALRFIQPTVSQQWLQPKSDGKRILFAESCLRHPYINI